MSHIHVPDGVLPLWLVALGWIVAGAVLVVGVRRISTEEWMRRLPLLGVMAALMIVGMTVEIVPIGYHLNMSVLAGIILGPMLGFVAAFVVNVILAMFGHGGVTVIGLNTLVVGAEAGVGFLLFRALVGLLSERRVVWAAGISVLLSLVVSSLLMIGIVAAANVTASVPASTPPETLNFRSPFGGGLLSWELLAGHDGQHGLTDVGTFAKLVLSLGSIGWLLEAVVTALIVRYVTRVRPDVVLNRIGRRSAGGSLAGGG